MFTRRVFLLTFVVLAAWMLSLTGPATGVTAAKPRPALPHQPLVHSHLFKSTAPGIAAMMPVFGQRCETFLSSIR